jgi:hypothetical protein
MKIIAAMLDANGELCLRKDINPWYRPRSIQKETHKSTHSFDRIESPTTIILIGLVFPSIIVGILASLGNLLALGVLI